MPDTPEHFSSDRSAGLTWRTTLVLALLTGWLGGVAFYALAVVPAGSSALGSHEAFGFVTRRVTWSINHSGAAVALILAVNLLAPPRGFRTRGRSTAFWTLGIMAACQVALFFLHPWLDQLLDAGAGRVIDRDAFYLRHRIYLLVTGAQWLAGAVHLRWLAAGRHPADAIGTRTDAA